MTALSIRMTTWVDVPNQRNTVASWESAKPLWQKYSPEPWHGIGTLIFSKEVVCRSRGCRNAKILHRVTIVYSAPQQPPSPPLLLNKVCFVHIWYVLITWFLEYNIIYNIIICHIITHIIIYVTLCDIWFPNIKYSKIVSKAYTFLSSRGFWMVLIWPIWAKIGQNLDVKNKISTSGTGPPPLPQVQNSHSNTPLVADNIFNSCNTQPVKVLFFNMIIHLKYNTIIMSIQSIHTQCQEQVLQSKSHWADRSVS